MRQIQQTLSRINQNIHQKCGHNRFSFHIENKDMKSTSSIQLRLDGETVSTIDWYFEKTKDGKIQVTMDSTTQQQHRNKKYNTILRLATILMMPHVLYDGKNISTIRSDAINPISVRSLLRMKFQTDVVWDAKGNKLLLRPSTQKMNQFFSTHPPQKIITEMWLPICPDMDMTFYQKELERAIQKMDCSLGT